MNKTILELSGAVNLVSSVAIEKNGKYLMIKEAKKHVLGLWNFPSGKVHLGETLLDAAKREVLEETGCQVEITDLISIYHYPWPDKEGITLRFNFWAKLVKKVTEKLEADILSAEWKTANQLLRLIKDKNTRSLGTDRMIREVLSGKRTSLDHLFTSSKPF
ncbi:MAG: NUDIX domain-containing protein [bacterium]|nr:NUDIX domain-containing protein [bacterium]